MALHRSKLGPVGGSGGGDNGDGGVVVDLDPLSAFALMGQRTEDTHTSGGTGPASSGGSGSSSSSGTTRAAGARREPSPPPASAQAPTGMGSWHAVELNLPHLPAPSSRVRVFILVAAVECFRDDDVVQHGLRLVFGNFAGCSQQLLELPRFF